MTSFIRVVDEPAIVLHTRPYRETSALVSVLSARHGRVNLVGRGVRGNRRKRAIQPFSVVRIGWTGRTALATLTGCEVDHQYWFHGNTLASAFYLAELVMRLVGEREPHPRLYAGLVWGLANLDASPSTVLRSLEKLLLEELGYGLDFRRDVDGKPLSADRSYRLQPDLGFVAAEAGFPGRALLSIGEEDFLSADVRRVAKQLFREALAEHLGPRPLVSRQLLVNGS
jgi:DNA repair protein RecO (recombination protein O)